MYNFAYTFAHEAASGAQNVYATPTRAGVVSYNLDATPLTVSIIVGFGSGGMASSTSYASTVNVSCSLRLAIGRLWTYMNVERLGL